MQMVQMGPKLKRSKPVEARTREQNVKKTDLALAYRRLKILILLEKQEYQKWVLLKT